MLSQDVMLPQFATGSKPKFKKSNNQSIHNISSKSVSKSVYILMNPSGKNCLTWSI